MIRKAKIGIWVPQKHAKATYKNENYNIRQNAGMAVVADILRREGHQVEYASSAAIGGYDFALVSITAAVDWRPFLRERQTWAKCPIVIAGGPGVLNIRPHRPWVDYFVLGRAEGAIEKLIAGEAHRSIIDSKNFNPDGEYHINQAEGPYPHRLTLENGASYQEGMIGCPYACHFCGYTWHRKPTAGEFRTGDLWSGGEDIEMAILDIAKGARITNLDRLRTTAIDGTSERLRALVNKPITSDVLRATIYRLATEGRKPGKGRQIIFYNILGLPTETEADWHELYVDIEAVDRDLPQTSRYGEARGLKIVIHSTPFNATPGTPLATARMPQREYRGALSRELGPDLEGLRIYDGRGLFVADSQTVEGQATVSEIAIMLRATEQDSDRIAAWARTTAFDNLPNSKKQATLAKHFDLDRMHQEYTADDLPTRYLRSHRQIKYRTELNGQRKEKDARIIDRR